MIRRWVNRPHMCGWKPGWVLQLLFALGLSAYFQILCGHFVFFLFLHDLFLLMIFNNMNSCWRCPWILVNCCLYLTENWLVEGHDWFWLVISHVYFFHFLDQIRWFQFLISNIQTNGFRLIYPWRCCNFSVLIIWGVQLIFYFNAFELYFPLDWLFHVFILFNILHRNGHARYVSEVPAREQRQSVFILLEFWAVVVIFRAEFVLIQSLLRDLASFKIPFFAKFLSFDGFVFSLRQQWFNFLIQATSALAVIWTLFLQGSQTQLVFIFFAFLIILPVWYSPVQIALFQDTFHQFRPRPIIHFFIQFLCQIRIWLYAHRIYRFYEETHRRRFRNLDILLRYEQLFTFFYSKA